ncbi:hypothetical protein QBC38DRAFT_467097 [Podospora fimiseda]|uniref:Swi5-dependent recombination DNA repair protein 1 n=1 Tax=Podospora fimiseda TaxID=252190 RepID=A0AAN7BX06_9PEZI|nr:hypothetical protein QBC38DRAFT_467097 [Podospora fimiseda]
MSSQTPNGNNAPPSAKRRRAEAANATLKKPFKSPMINRQQATPTTNKSSAASTQNLPSVNKFTKPPQPKVPVTPLRPQKIPAPSPLSTSSSFTTPFINHTPQQQQQTPIPSRYQSGPKNDEDDLLARVQASQNQMNAHLRALQTELDLIRQAKRIEDASKKKRPGEEIDAELKELVTKWKGASRLAAEELFELVKGRVESMGGGEAWRRSRRKGRGGGGFDDDEDARESKRRRCDYEDDVERRDEDEDGDGDGDGDKDEEEEEGFTMLMMLKSLNIEPEVLGWDAVEDKWVD